VLALSTFVTLVYLPLVGLAMLLGYALMRSKAPSKVLMACWLSLPPIALSVGTATSERFPGCANLLIDPLALAVISAALYIVVARWASEESAWWWLLLGLVAIAFILGGILPDVGEVP
jgi:hypothetical protein